MQFLQPEVLWLHVYSLTYQVLQAIGHNVRIDDGDRIHYPVTWEQGTQYQEEVCYECGEEWPCTAMLDKLLDVVYTLVLSGLTGDDVIEETIRLFRLNNLGL